MKIKLTDWGIASCYKDTIEINPVLFKYPKLLKSVLKHEIEHLKNKNFFSDFITDLKLVFDITLEGLKFEIKHPKLCFQSILPVWYHKKALCHNSFLIVAYLCIIVLIVFLLIVL